MEGRHGLTELYKPNGKVAADIVFVHGLFGHPYKTWSTRKSRSKSPQVATQSENRLSLPSSPHHDPSASDEDCSAQRGEGFERNVGDDKPTISGYNLWPKKMLPAVIPNARIFTWGYDADVNGFFSSASQNSIYQHANNLLSDLDDLRDSLKDKEVPIIFVVHSLGGIVVKAALNQSSIDIGTRLKRIAPATFGVVFLGTPHRGSKSASFGKIANQMSIIALRRPNLRLIRALERNSETLDIIGDTFRQTVLKHNMHLYSFREEKETTVLGLFSIMVVDNDSAKIGDSREELGSIPSDHSNMTKFESSHDIGFRRVSSQLRRWVERIEGTNAEYPAECLKSLDISEARERIYEVRDAHDNTFHWVFDSDKVAFVEWLQNEETVDKPIFWISGKPGSGKSTLMKFAMRDARTLGFLAKASPKTWTIAAFFFHDRGSETQKSLGGMLQEILHSILVQVPALLVFVNPFYLKLVKSQRTSLPKWEIRTLREALLAITQQRLVDVQLCLFIDALDEHMGDNELLVQLLKDIVKNSDGEIVKLKICIASRSWTLFTQQFGNCPGFAIHHYTAIDIRIYIESRLAIDRLGSQLSLDQTQRRAIFDQVASKAVGVFIWVRLVMDLIIKDVTDGTTFAALEDRITNLPKELEDLYAHTVRRIEPDYRSEAYVMLQIALCSLSPLSLKSFLAATRHYLGISALVSEGISHTMQLKTISSRGGGLLEAVGSLPFNREADPESDIAEDGIANYHVQFIHQTVRQYVQNNQGDISKQLRYRGSGYIFLLDFAVLKTSYESSDELMLRSNVFTYAKLYELSSQSPTEQEINRFFWLLDHLSQNFTAEDIGIWYPRDFLSSRLYLFLCRSAGGNSEKYKNVFFNMAVVANLNVYVRKKLEEKPLTFDFAICPLQIAATEEYIVPPDLVDRSRMIKTLVEAGYPIDHQSETSFTRFRSSDLAFVTPLGAFIFGQKFFAGLSEESSISCVKTLLEAGANPNARIRFLEKAEYDEMSERTRLLDKAKKYNETSILQYCVQFGSAPLVRLLLQYGAKLDNESEDFVNLFGYAVIRGNGNIMQVLEDHGCNLISQPTFTPIQGALLAASHVCIAPLGAPASRLFLPHRSAQVTEMIRQIEI